MFAGVLLFTACGRLTFSYAHCNTSVLVVIVIAAAINSIALSPISSTAKSGYG
jgi:hypothetical protein